MVNTPLLQKQCCACIHYCPKQEQEQNTDKYLCLIENKVYVETENINENGEAFCSCHNGKFEYNKEKYKNVRY